MFKFIYRLFHRHYHTHYNGVYRHAKKLFVFDLGLLGVALLMLASSLVFFFWKPSIADQIDVALSLGESRIKSGETVHVTITYTNRSKLHLEKPTLALRLPRGFVVDRTRTPENVFNKNSVFTLATIEPGGTGSVDLYGELWAEPKNSENVYATLSYQPEGLTRREQKLAAFHLTLPESVLSGMMEIPEKSFPNQKLAFTYTLLNQGTLPLTNIRLNTTGQENLIPEKETQNIKLQPGQRYTYNGAFTAPSTSREYTIGIIATVLVNNERITQSTVEKKLVVLGPAFNLQASAIDEVKFIEPGSVLPVKISWNNTSPFPLDELLLKVEFAPGFVDIAKTAREAKIKASGNALIFTKATRTALANGVPGGRDEFTLPIHFLTRFTRSTANARFTLTPVMQVKSAAVPDQLFEARGSVMTLPLATELRLSAQSRYYTPEGDQLGRGPLPAKVGSMTKYWIFVEVNNTFNPVTEASFTATLPAGVTFTGKQSVTIGRELGFDQASRTVSWRHDTLPADSTTGLYFEVAVQPTDSDVGKTLTLLEGGGKFRATDQLVNKTFELPIPILTTRLPSNDRGARLGAQVVR